MKVWLTWINPRKIFEASFWDCITFMGRHRYVGNTSMAKKSAPLVRTVIWWESSSMTMAVFAWVCGGNLVTRRTWSNQLPGANGIWKLKLVAPQSTDARVANAGGANALPAARKQTSWLHAGETMIVKKSMFFFRRRYAVLFGCARQIGKMNTCRLILHRGSKCLWSRDDPCW